MNSPASILFGCLLAVATPHAAVSQESASSEVLEYDVVVYGGTAAGVMAAVQAARLEKSVVLVSPARHLGGLTSGGLGFTDTGDKSVIGGLAREFYHRVWQYYQAPAAWKWQRREEYGNQGQGTPAIDGAQRTMWIFEPHVAETVLQEFVDEFHIPIHADQWLDRESGVAKDGARIVSIRTLSGRTYRGRVFIDATYEGDLMAAAGVAYHVGREARSQYDERWNGVQVGVLHHRHHFGALAEPIDPYVVPGDASSGLLPRISAEPPGEYGAADRKVQAYCFRMCLTNCPENRVAFAKPAGYDPAQYELLLRIFQAGWRETFEKFDPLPNRKTDTNNHGPFSTDNIGYNHDYPEADYARRREIIREHETYQQGLMYFLANDPRVPDDVRTAMSAWGLAGDEFVDNGHWPYQLYVREARRMIGRFVMTENELLKRRPTPEPIGMGSYGMDSHNVQRYVTPDGTVQNEGDIGVGTDGPYQIALGAIQPLREQCDNLLVPVCVSSSHIAYGSIRMEPVFMILGQAAATVAGLAVEENTAVQDVAYTKLRTRLLQDGQVLEPK
ncbi:MAG: FAD-dependent oxidoreductase [Pirellulaceae bacterium]